MALRSLTYRNLDCARTVDNIHCLKALSTLVTSSNAHLSVAPHKQRVNRAGAIVPASLTPSHSIATSWSAARCYFHTSCRHPAKDWYKILGVPRDADAKVIKQAYFKMAKKYHPDSHPNDKNAKERFQEISEAYDVLSDDEKKREYDISSDFFNPRTSRASGMVVVSEMESSHRSAKYRR